MSKRSNEDTTVEQRRSARLVAGMGGCYALGTFTDNFYKQAAVLLAASLQLTWVQSVATVLYALPFILFSAWAGWLADRVSKRNIVIAAKVTELIALFAGAAALVAEHWWGMLTVVFLMGLQATAFSPALNGSIPESFPAHKVPRINSLIKLASTAAVLLGIAAAGVCLDMRPGNILPSFGIEDGAVYGRYATGIFIILISALGVVTAFTLRKKTVSGGASTSPFPWLGPVDSVRHLWECRKDEQLFLVLLAEAYFYGVAAMAVVSVANLAESLQYSATMASLFSAVLMIGVAVGAIIAGRSTADSWKQVLLPSASGMGFFLALIALTPLLPKGPVWFWVNPQLVWLGIMLFLAGVCGGIYLIPLASFIQVRPAPEEKGKVLGVSNFLSFVSIAVWGVIFAVVGLMPAAWTFVFYGVSTLLFAPVVIGRRMGRLKDASLKDAAGCLLGLVLRSLLSLRYRVEARGMESIPAPLGAGHPGMLILPNHPALIDPVIIYSLLAGISPRPLADQGQMQGPLQKLAAKAIRAVIIPDLRKTGRRGEKKAREALETIIDALKQGDNILLYPSGKVYRSEREELGANSAVAHILSAVPGCQVVLARSQGLWGSSFGYALGKTPSFIQGILRGALALLCNGLFFSPRREVCVEFAEVRDLPSSEGKMALNAYLEQFYNAVEQPAIAVPRYFWKGRQPYFTPKPEMSAPRKEAALLSDGDREAVFTLLRRIAGLPADHAVLPEQRLSADLGLDSLLLMEVATGIEVQTGNPVTRLDLLNTVEDCLLAASGHLEGEETRSASAVPKSWFSLDGSEEGEELLSVPEGAENLVESFLRLVRQSPSRPLLADRTGLYSRKKILVAALILAKRFSRLPDKRLGIMLPASPAAMITWLAVLLSGKEPVMLNWTVGRVNMLHCLSLASVTHAVTATALLEQLEQQGNALDDMPLEWIALDEMFTELTAAEKIMGMLRATMHALGILTVSSAHVQQCAAILFTSGSEAAPKGVPLTHKNIMSNARDLVAMLKVQKKDKVLAMLPPFHSFGLLVGNALPAATGIAAVSHPNPTESAPLVRLVQDFTLTLLGATPTFLEGMLTRAAGTSALDSLRFAFVGAEKCPDRVYDAFASCCPNASLCEGYGITECSPVIAVNPPGNVARGTIGYPLPSVITAIVEVGESAEGASHSMSRVTIGETGMLLVRGPSIFSGYLGDAPSPFISFEGSEWYRTGDLVASGEDGRMTFKGRLKRFVKVGGEMVSLPQMEEVLQTAFSGHEGLPSDGKPYLAIESTPGSEEAGKPELVAFTVLPLTVREVNTALRTSGLSALYAVQRVMRLETIPLLGTGKTDYRTLRQMAGE